MFRPTTLIHFLVSLALILNGVGAAAASVVKATARAQAQGSQSSSRLKPEVHEWAFGGTADLRREHSERVSDTRVVLGLRFWF